MKYPLCFMSELKLKFSKINTIKDVKDFKKDVKPATNISQDSPNQNSGGLIALLHKLYEMYINDFCANINNNYIIKYYIKTLRIVLIFVYIPPYANNNDYNKNPYKMNTIDNIYRDLSTIINLCKSLNIRFIIFGDFNARIGDEINDHNVNPMGIDKFKPFCNMFNLKILNKQKHSGIPTYKSNNKKSIIDYILIEDHHDWNQIYKITMNIYNNTFGSDHKPIDINIEVINDIKYEPKYILFKPFYKLQLTDNEQLLSETFKILQNKLQKDNYFKNIISKNYNQNKYKLLDDEQRLRIIDTIYNYFIYNINETLIQNNCYKTKIINNEKYNMNQTDNILNNLLTDYEKTLNINVNNKSEESLKINKISVLESKIEIRSDYLFKLQQKQFIEKINNYEKNELEKQLFIHLSNFYNNNSDDAIITYKNNKLISDIDIITNAQNYYSELYGTIPQLPDYQNIDQIINDIINESYSDDDNYECRQFTIDELKYALKNHSNKKSIGLDGIGYFLLKQLCKNDYLCSILLTIINIIYNISKYPSSLNISKLYLLKKKDIISLFKHFRGINITNNLKNIINFMRLQRNKNKYMNAINPNHAAYVENVGCELLLYTIHINIYKITYENNKVLIGISDFDMAFDRVNRNGIIIKLNDIEIKGKNIRLINDELKNTKIEIVYKNKHSERVEIKNGLPQGHTSGGPIYNIYTNSILNKTLIVKTICYNKNNSSYYYADDGIKLALNTNDLQCSYDFEYDESKKWNLLTNSNKSNIAKYSRNKSIKNQFINDPKIKINNNNIPENNTFTLFGYKHNFDMLNFTKSHILNKINTFKKLKNMLYFKRIFGSKISLKTQRKMYLKKIRTAILYGLSITNLTISEYKKLDTIQHQIITSILGVSPKTNAGTCRIILGIPPFNKHLLKIKLINYYKIFKKLYNNYSYIIKRNYHEIYYKYKLNNDSLLGIKNQWMYPTFDYIKSINLMNIDTKYTNINNLPNKRSEWIKILNRKMRDNYEKEYNKFIKSNGKLLTMIFNEKSFTKNNSKIIYPGLIKYLSILYQNDNVCTNDISGSLKILINSTKLNWIFKNNIININMNPNGNVISSINNDNNIRLKLCPFCKRLANDFRLHLVLDCKAMKRKKKIVWTNNLNDLKEKISLLEQIQKKITIL